MNKLSVDNIKNQLIEADKIKKVKVAKMKMANKRKSTNVGIPKDTSNRLTKIKQVDVPSGKKMGSGTQKMGIPQAKPADKIVMDMKKTSSTSTKNSSDNGPKPPPVKRLSPNQTSKMKDVSKNAIKNTAQSSTARKTSFPNSKTASEYIDKQGHGSSNLGASNKRTPTVGKPKVKKLNSTTRPKSSTKKGKESGNTSNTIPNKGNVGKAYKEKKQPKDAPGKITWNKMKGSSNIVETGIVISLEGKPKAKFDIVNGSVLQTMVETYKSHGYNVDISRTNNISWKKDKKLMGLLWESMDAKHNFALKTHHNIRTEALKRFDKLVGDSYNSIYESRSNFNETVVTAFNKIFNAAEKKYIDNLEIFECIARVRIDEEIIDAEIITKATDSEMALRQVRSTFMEEYGMDVKIQHIFVDGKKFNPNKIVEWCRKN